MKPKRALIILPLPATSIQVRFSPGRRRLQDWQGILSFDGEALAKPEESDHTWAGTAKLHYEVEWLVNQGWEAMFDFTYGPAGFNMHLRGLSGEDIGSISSSNRTFVIPGGGTGRGRFRAS